MSIFKKAETFQECVIRSKPPTSPVSALCDRWSKRTTTFIAEELGELEDACRNGDRAAALDALIDCMYFCAGAVTQLGVDGDAALEIVHTANMTKRPGVKATRGLEGDAVKPNWFVDPTLDHLFNKEESEHA